MPKECPSLPDHIKDQEGQSPPNVRFVTTGMSELGIALAGVSQRKEVTLVKKEHRSLSGFSGRVFRTIAGEHTASC